MTKKHFISLADAIREYNKKAFKPGTSTVSPLQFGYTQLLVLADWCQAQNPKFNRQLWLDYVTGRCGPGGGKVKDA